MLEREETRCHGEREAGGRGDHRGRAAHRMGRVKDGDEGCSRDPCVGRRKDGVTIDREVGDCPRQLEAQKLEREARPREAASTERDTPTEGGQREGDEERELPPRADRGPSRDRER